MTDMKKLALDCGFSVAEDMDVSTLEFMQEVRDMCSADRCRSYGKTWACPPACGSLEHWREKASRFGKGIIMQTIGEREDSYDFEAMMEIEAEHKSNFNEMYAVLRDNGKNVLAIGAGCCTQCVTCTYPDAPCRFPEKMTSSMEAYGMLVLEICKDNGLQYYYGSDKMAYTSCFLL